MKNINYSTSQIIKRLGVSREMLRYYENEGLLSPERTEGSQYRKYSDLDGFEILRIKMLLSYSIPLKKIPSVIDSQTLEAQSLFLSRQIEQLENNIERLQHELFRIRKQRSFIQDAINFDAITEMETHGMYRLMLLGDGVKSEPSAEKIAQEWLSKAPMTEIGWTAEWPAEDAFREDTLIKTKIGLLAFPQCVEEAHICIDPPVIHSPSGHSLRVMVKTDNPFYIHSSSLIPLNSYIHEHNFRVVSDINGRYSGSTCINSKEYYFSVRVNVKCEK